MGNTFKQMEERLRQLPQLARNKQNENRHFFSRLARKPPKDLDNMMLELHREEFSRTNCQDCANCCKTTGPLFTEVDIQRISRHLKMKPGQFISTYLRIDEEQDYVLQQLPCPFLAPDNHCAIYDVRPKACREFPHTDRKKFHQIGHLTRKNVAVCPAAYAIVEEMKRRIKV